MKRVADIMGEITLASREQASDIERMNGLNRAGIFQLRHQAPALAAS